MFDNVVITSKTVVDYMTKIFIFCSIRYVNDDYIEIDTINEYLYYVLYSLIEEYHAGLKTFKGIRHSLNDLINNKEITW